MLMSTYFDGTYSADVYSQEGTDEHLVIYMISNEEVNRKTFPNLDQANADAEPWVSTWREQ